MEEDSTGDKVDNLKIDDSDSNLTVDSQQDLGDHLEELKERMLDRLVNTNAHFRSQQKDEPDLTCSQKFDIAQGILDRHPNVFLSRFGKFLVNEDMDFFQQLSKNYEIEFYLQEIHKRLAKNSVQVRNRRFEALKRLQKEGNYFSEQEMRIRDPLLYEQLVGQYLTEEERKKLEEIDMSELRVSTIILNHYDQQLITNRRKVQQEREDDQWEEGDSDEEEEEEEEKQETKLDGQTSLSLEEKDILRQEFISSMHRRFLDGQDKDFDYSGVDDNLDYDDLEIRQLDEEEKYFDDEEPYTFKKPDGNIQLESEESWDKNYEEIR